MPLIKCGDKAWKWGNSGKCYNGPNEGENKRKAILQGVSYEGSHKVNKMLKHEKGWTQEDIVIVEEILAEGTNRGYNNSLIDGVASYFNNSTKDDDSNPGEQVFNLEEKKKQNEKDGISVQGPPP